MNEEERPRDVRSTAVGMADLPWFSLARREASDQGLDEPETEAFLRKVRSSRYVMVVRYNHAPPLVFPYPGVDDRTYDDMYERTLGGYSSGGHVELYKPDGSSFTDVEKQDALDLMVSDFNEGADMTGDDDCAIEPYVFDDDAMVARCDVSDVAGRAPDDESGGTNGSHAE